MVYAVFLKQYGWYWGPISGEAAEKILSNEPDGSFIVRDSSDDHYIFSLSFRLNSCVRHVRIEHDQGKLCHIIYKIPNKNMNVLKPFLFGAQVILASAAARSSSRTPSLTLSRTRSSIRAVVAISSFCIDDRFWVPCEYSCFIRCHASNKYRACNIRADSSS